MKKSHKNSHTKSPAKNSSGFTKDDKVHHIINLEFKMFENVAKTILFEMKYEYSETAASKVIPKHAH